MQDSQEMQIENRKELTVKASYVNCLFRIRSGNVLQKTFIYLSQNYSFISTRISSGLKDITWSNKETTNRKSLLTGQETHMPNQSYKCTDWVINTSCSPNARAVLAQYWPSLFSLLTSLHSVHTVKTSGQYYFNTVSNLVLNQVLFPNDLLPLHFIGL